MKLSNNPFFVLGATPTDSRSKLYQLADLHSLDTDGVDDALRTLTNPIKRQYAELRWFIGKSQSEVAEILSFFEDCQTENGCCESKLQLVEKNNENISGLNFLLYLLPYCDNGTVDNVVLKICRCFDSLETKDVLCVINDTRKQAQIAPIASISALEAAYREYCDDVCNTVLDRIKILRSSSEAYYRILITNVSKFGFSSVIERIIRDYELYEVDRFRKYIDEIHNASENLQKFFNKDERPQNVAKIEFNISCWSEEIQPLQNLADTLGMSEITKPYEQVMFHELEDCCISLLNLGLDTSGIALGVAQRYLSLIPNNGEYESRRQSVFQLIQKMKPAVDQYELEKNRRAAEEEWKKEQEENDKNARMQAEQRAKEEKEKNIKKRAAENQRLAEEAWQNEQRRNDEYNKRRAEEAAAAEKNRIESLREQQRIHYEEERRIAREKVTLEIKRKKRRKILTFSIIGGISILIAFAFFMIHYL